MITICVILCLAVVILIMFVGLFVGIVYMLISAIKYLIGKESDKE